MADPRTINIPGNGNDTQQYELAPGLLQYVQAVYVEVDNTAGGDARPVLTLSEQSGVVIAKKRQNESVPAGESGSATWALRDDESGGGIRYETHNRGRWLYIVATGTDPATGLGSIYLEGDNEIQMRTPFMFLEGNDSAPFRIYQYTLLDVQVDAVNLIGTPGGVSIYGDEGGVFMQVAKNGSGGLSIQDEDGTLYATFDPGGQMHLRAGMPILYDLP